MAPRKKKTAPAVVGTVSTRSTRRESIINVEIVPRSGKAEKKQTKQTKKLKQINPPVQQIQAKKTETMEARPEILELLREWSDDENSQNRNMVKIEQIEITDSPVKNLPDDQQSLIDILEGKQSDEDASLQVKKLVAVDNPIVNVDSPKVEEPDIIEECVVEDDSFIIEFADQTTSSSVETEVTQSVKSPKSQEENSGNSITYTLEIEKAEELPFSKVEVEEEVKYTVENFEVPEDELQSEETGKLVKSEIVDCVQVTEVGDTVEGMGTVGPDNSQAAIIPDFPLSDNLEDKMSQISLKNDSQHERYSSEKLNVIKSPNTKTCTTETRKSPKGSPRASPLKGPGVSDMDSESSENKSSISMETDSISNESSQGNVVSNKLESETAEFPPREKKLAECWIIKRPSRKMVFTRTCSSKLKLIDDTIDEVLRMYTSDDESDSKKPQVNTAEPSTNQQDAAVNKEMEKLSLSQESGAVPEIAEEKLQSKIKISFSRKGLSQSSTPKTKIKSEKKTQAKELKKKKTKPRSRSGENSEEVRRSDRIKTIAPIKKKSHGLVRSKSEPNLEIDNSDSNSMGADIEKPSPTVSPRLSKFDKLKSKSKSSDNLECLPSSSPELPKPNKKNDFGKAEIEARLKSFAHLKENSYKTDRQTCKEAKEMVCDCYLAEEDIQNNEFGCGDDCLNRLLMIECGESCQIGTRCTNRRFQRGLFAPVEVFKTEKKGLGLRAAANIAYGEFILEYVGEVLNPDEFDKRAEVYSKDKNIHFYFMSLRADAIIDATMKGNISRFINHSCDPNAETQKWTVNGELRIGFFSTRTILAGEEITFDYRFQRYGKEAQRCFCEASICRGWLGDSPNESEEEDEEEEEEEEVKVTTTAEPSLSRTLSAPNLLDQQVSPELPLVEDASGFGRSEVESMDVDAVSATSTTDIEKSPLAPLEAQETSKKSAKKKVRKEVLYEEIDQLNEDIDMLGTTGLKNQAHTLKLSRLMVRAKDLTQRKKLLRVLRRGDLPCRRLFLDYHGLRLMHGYMIDAQQLKTEGVSVPMEIMQTKLELLQTLAVLPIQNKTMLIESKVLPAVEKWAKNEDIVEDNDQKDEESFGESFRATDFEADPEISDKIEEIKFLAAKLLEEWANMKEIFRIPKRQRIEQMKEHEKEANKKFMESSYSAEKEAPKKNDHRYRTTWSRCKTERETTKRRSEDKPSAEFLKISKHERRKLFALQMELREEERRMKQRELWRQHEMNCMLIGADPRFTAPFDPSKGFQYIWNPSLGQWQALPVPSQSSGSTQQVTTKQTVLGPFTSPMLNVSGSMPGTPSQYPGIQNTLPPMVPGVAPTLSNPLPGVATSLPGGLSNPGHGLPGQLAGMPGTLAGIAQGMPIYQEAKEDPSQVKFAGPIPPPVKLPPKWKCAKDKYGRPYYYHIKIRKSQWEPPPLSEPMLESSESTTTESSSSSSSSGSSSDTDSEDDIDDSKLLIEVRRQIDSTPKLGLKTLLPDYIKKEGSDSVTPSPEIKMESDEDESIEDPSSEPLSSIDIRLKEQFNLESPNEIPKKKRRVGLCQQIIISPRTEEDRLQSKEDMKRYKATKEKLKRQKEQMLLTKRKLKSEALIKVKEKKTAKNAAKTRIKEMAEWNDEHARKIKEVFRSTMATTVVGVLNAYRKPDCREARITNTEDFKHLARKLTHFVMLKEIKHISTIDELVCTDNVRAKAREYIKKYMSKFGDVYQKRQDEPDFKD